VIDGSCYWVTSHYILLHLIDPSVRPVALDVTPLIHHNS